MRKRNMLLIAAAVLITVAINAFAYTTLINGSNTMLNLIKKFNFSYVAPKTYFGLVNRIQRKPMTGSNSEKKLEDLISSKSSEFIKAAFRRDANRIRQLLDPSTDYIRSKDGSSFIRYIENGVHVEGYMATDKKLINAKPRWHIIENDHTITCSMEVYIENNKAPELWYIHFKKVKDDWRVYMLENNI